MNPVLPPWLQRVYDAFLNNVAENRLAHAVLLDASLGWGVEALVQNIASTIMEADVDFEANRNLDLLYIDVAEKARFISIDQIREASDFLGSTSREGVRKLVVIQQADKMSIPASQALLKILEEPPVDKHLLLVTTKCGLLLPTIRSRCQRLVVLPGTEEEVSEFFNSQGLDKEKLSEYLDEYGGAPYAALSALNNKILNLKQKLAQVTRSQASLVPVAKDLQREEVDDVLLRWQYVTLRLAHNSAVVQPVAQFYDELSDVRRQFREVPGLDRERQYVRLLIKWRSVLNQHQRLQR